MELEIQKAIPFYTPIITTNLKVDTNSAIKECLYVQSISESTTISNVGGYQSSYFNEEQFVKKFPEFVDKIKAVINLIEQEQNTKLKIDNAWININKKHSFNLPHVHPQASFSAVLYLKTPENSGKIVFKNPTPSEHYNINDEVEGYWGAYKVLPKESDFFVFPSYLSHYVEPNLNEEDRISIAINFVNVFAEGKY